MVGLRLRVTSLPAYRPEHLIDRFVLGQRAGARLCTVLLDCTTDLRLPRLDNEHHPSIVLFPGQLESAIGVWSNRRALPSETQRRGSGRDQMQQILCP